jgi:predicted type IV restriction endonuclease
MLGIINAQEVLKNTVKIIQRAQIHYLPEDEREKSDFLFENHIASTFAEMMTSDQTIVNGPFKIMEKHIFDRIVRKHDAMLGYCVWLYFPNDITHVWF